MYQKPSRNRVVAIGLDAGDPGLIRRWVAEGHLPEIGKLLARSAIGEIESSNILVAETPWTALLTACQPQTTNYWSPIAYLPDYRFSHVEAHQYTDQKPFYAYARERRAIILDVPQTRLLESLEGVQVLGWGAHSQQGPSESEPAELLVKLRRTYGDHPAYDSDWMLVPETRQRGPWLERALIQGIDRRTRMCVDLMRTEPWDLVFAVYGETHSAGHSFWHFTQPDHPLRDVYKSRTGDPLLNVFRELDRAIGDIVAAAPPDARVVLFASHGMKANSSDLPSLVFLPELLYRDSFGTSAIAETPADAALPPPGIYRDSDWSHAIWAMQQDRNWLRGLIRKHARLGISRRFDRLFGSNLGLQHPYEDRFGWMPLVWYRPHWRNMRAFAIPSYSDGYVRLNVKGREADGKIEPSAYGAECDRIAGLLRGLRDARTGRPAVRDIVRTRQAADEAGNLPDADLVVLWSDPPYDAVDGDYGRIGPVPYRRSGDHTPHGFLAVSGPGIGTTELPKGDLIDLGPTILDLMGVPRPNHFDGRSRLTYPSAA